MTGVGWRILEPLLPGSACRGRRWTSLLREIINAIFSMLQAGCAWRLLPNSFSPWRTVYRWIAQLHNCGVFEALKHHLLVMLDRERCGREASPTAAVIDRQSVKTTGSSGPRSYDARERVMGYKRHAMVDTDGRELRHDNHPADIQDRDSAPPLMRASRRRWPFVQLAFIGRGYAGHRVARATAIRVEIVRTPKRSGLFLGQRTPPGGRTLLRLGQPKPTPCQGFRHNHRLRQRLPLRRLGHLPITPHRTFPMRIEADSQQTQHHSRQD